MRTNEAAERALRETFGRSSWRPSQQEAAYTLLSGRDLLCVMPTGAGKSLCFQLPAAVHGGLTLVVSPLIALMTDQVLHMGSTGVPAAMLSSASDEGTNEQAVQAVRAGTVRLLYVSPERLQTARFQALMKAAQPWLIVVDEAHCVDRWGRQFRPVYRQIGTFVRSLPRRPVLCAMTATADRRTRLVIRQSLGLRHAKQVVLPVVRPNLTLRVHPTLHPEACIDTFLSQHEGAQGIIYCATRKRTASLAARLTAVGHSAAAYHAALSDAERARIQKDFTEGTLGIVCATVAFGMGVDAPHIRFVLHDALPEDLTDYAQQTGRAGRDGAPAECLLLLTPGDMARRIARVRETLRDRTLKLPFRLLSALRLSRELQVLLNVLLDRHCIAAAAARCFGQRTASCGVCSACADRASGTPRLPVPRVRTLEEDDLVRWWMLIARQREAARMNCASKAILSDDALDGAVKRRYVSAADIPDEAARARLAGTMELLSRIHLPARPRPKTFRRS